MQDSITNQTRHYAPLIGNAHQIKLSTYSQLIESQVACYICPALYHTTVSHRFTVLPMDGASPLQYVEVNDVKPYDKERATPSDHEKVRDFRGP